MRMTLVKYPSEALAVKRLPPKPSRITPSPVVRYALTSVRSSSTATMTNAAPTTSANIPSTTASSRLDMMPLAAGLLRSVLAMFNPAQQDALRTERGKAADRGADAGEALDDQIHPREAVDDHQVDEATAENVLEQAAKKKGRIELAFRCVLNPSDDDVDQEQREKELERVRLDGRAVMNCGVVELSGYAVEVEVIHWMIPSVCGLFIVAVVVPCSVYLVEGIRVEVARI